MTDWQKVYDLAEDEGYVRHLQKGTLAPDYRFGLAPDPALVGSDEWWRALGTAALPIVTVEGEVSEVYLMENGPTRMFALRQDDGSTTHRLRRGDDAMWKVGRRARIEYVVQLDREGHEAEVVVRMWLGPERL